MNKEALDKAAKKYWIETYGGSVPEDLVDFKAGAEWGYNRALQTIHRAILQAGDILNPPRPSYPTGTSEPAKTEDTDTILSHTENSI